MVSKGKSSRWQRTEEQLTWLLRRLDSSDAGGGAQTAQLQ